MRVVAILTAYNEERFIATCLEHLWQQGVEVYLIDNGSTDRTVTIAERALNRGLIGIETFPRHGMFSLRPLLERTEQLASLLDADWFMHADVDEIHLPPRSNQTLAQAFADVEAQGYNAINFLEFTFLPTQESPDHDHPHFLKTMLWYYPFLPRFPHCVRAWKKQQDQVELAWSAGHRLRFSSLRMYPESFKMRHYMMLSLGHGIEKYVQRVYDPAEVAGGWHVMRSRLREELIRFPSENELRRYVSDDLLDASNPRLRHYLAEFIEQASTKAELMPAADVS